jgi:hypothetical protein
VSCTDKHAQNLLDFSYPFAMVLFGLVSIHFGHVNVVLDRDRYDWI